MKSLGDFTNLIHFSETSSFRVLKRFIVLGMAAAALAACGSSNGSATRPTTNAATITTTKPVVTTTTKPVVTTTTKPVVTTTTKPVVTTTTKPVVTTTTTPVVTTTTKPVVTTTTKPVVTTTTTPAKPTIYVQVLSSGTVGTYSGGGYNCDAPGDNGFACFEVVAQVLVNGYFAPSGTTTITVSTPDGQVCNRSVDSPVPSEDNCYIAVGAPTSVTVTFTFADGTSASQVTPVSPTD